MDQTFRDLLERNRASLVESIDLTSGLWDLMRQEKLINVRVQHQIESDPDKFKQVAKLLDHLLKKDNAAFELFCSCLRENDQGQIVSGLLTPGGGQGGANRGQPPGAAAGSTTTTASISGDNMFQGAQIQGGTFNVTLKN